MLKFDYDFQIIFLILTNYISGKIEGHLPSQSTQLKIGGGGEHLPSRIPERL